MAGARPFLVAAAAVVFLLAVLSAASADDSDPSILTPIAMTPVSDDGSAEVPAADYSDADDAAPAGAPLGTTATKPEDDSGAAGYSPPPSGNGASAVGATTAAAVAFAVAAAGLPGLLS